MSSIPKRCETPCEKVPKGGKRNKYCFYDGSMCPFYKRQVNCGMV